MFSLLFEQVYIMSSHIRGRALIINNRNFRDGNGDKNPSLDRGGSDLDYENLSTALTEIGFEMAKRKENLTNLTAKVV